MTVCSRMVNPTVEHSCEPESVTGDGLKVKMCLRLRAPLSNGSSATTVPVIMSMPKAEARKLAEQIRQAADRPEPGCSDPSDHFHGHCGCR